PGSDFRRWVWITIAPFVTQIPEQINTLPDSLCCELVLPAGTLRLKGELTPALLQTLIREMKGSSH
ncbi:hypothetical protein Q0S94_25405, partial [Escherichia coli O110:H10]